MLTSKILLILSLGGLSVLAHGSQKPGNNHKDTRTRNFIMVIPDGFGPASETMARDWVHWNSNDTTYLPIDEMVIGQIRTRASNSYVTDSSASATAYACGIKTFNGAVGITDDHVPKGTVLEAAKAQGFKTGLVVTSRITHATPACYASHVSHRDDEANIASQLIGYTHPLGSTVDLIMGGGKCFFTPQSAKDSCRKDDVDLLAWAKNSGYSVFGDRKSFDKKQKLPYVGLFTSGHMSYNIDRDAKKEPSLSEMSIKALDDLLSASKNNKKGFFIMIEASRIDHAGHSNDPVGHLHEILEYNKAMLAIRKWIDKHHNSPTTLISTADHECGGLTVGEDYDYQPKYFVGAEATAETLADVWKNYDGADLKNFLVNNVYAKYGISSPTDDEVSAGLAQKGKSAFAVTLAAAISKRLGVEWGTGGHTGVDVTLYGWGVNHQQLAGNHENTEVADFVARHLNLDLRAISKKLQANTTWVKDHVVPQPGWGVPTKRDSTHTHN